MTPSEVFQRFAADAATDPLLSTQLAAWSDARSAWRSNWTQRGAASAMTVFQSAVPGSHPIAEHAPELNSWRAAWQKAPIAEQNELAELFVRAVALIERSADSLDEACAMFGDSTGGGGLPLAIVSTAASALHPSRFVILCDAWLSLFHEDAQPAKTISAYPLLNADALRWLAAAESDVLPAALAASPRSDRMAVVCSWVARNPAPAAERKFDVTQKKYKDWPPMW
jgi:hypothetical protein